VVTAKLDHVAFGVRNLGPSAHLLASQLGGREYGSGPGNGFAFWQWEFEGGGVVEIITPDGPPDGFLHRFLRAREAGPHHVTFKVPDLHAATERARAFGYEPVGFDDRWAGWKEAFLHPKQAQGIVVQLAESDPSADAGLDGAPVRPPFPDVRAADEPARLVGLVLSSHSEERARHQWEAFLGGALERRGDRLVFRWPDSTLEIGVLVQPGVSEGPLALEVAAARRLALPEGPHSALRLPIVQVAG
jgi:methylmalonyl-CoA/ethylmalonyl-CoA epimerase